jgi:hypothetical protein
MEEAVRELDEEASVCVVFNYYDPYSKFWPGPDGHTIETRRFIAMQRHPPKVVTWRDSAWVLDTVLIDATPTFGRVEVHYMRATIRDELR